ncbi:Ycf48-like protein [Myxococcaceae bacterium]|jgi:photosystem II stability/assembly factor-like uncharacterized protein|nr:Ycf48-like protein [Myxococcaceae bacterium]
MRRSSSFHALGAAAVALVLAACGGSGEVTEQLYQIHDDLFSVSVVDDRNAVAVGYYGSILRTDDGGNTWKERDSGTTKSLYSVSMADAKHGWAVGQLGTILRTDDGGDTWKPQPNMKQEQGAHLFGVHAIDANNAWVVGEWGTRLFTSNGGQTWEDQSLAIDEEHPQFVWLSPVDQDKVRKGEKVFEDVGLNYVFCLKPPSRKCWIAGEFGYSFWSEDLGKSWNRGEIRGEIEPPPVALGYNEIDLSPEDIAALEQFAKTIEDQPHLNVLIDPKASDREIADFVKDGKPDQLFDLLDARISSVKAVLEEAGLLSDRMRVRGSPPYDWEDFQASDPDFLKRYLDARRAPSPGVAVNVGQNPYLFTVRFQDENNGLISGLGGIMLQTSDGGRTWSYEQTGRKQALFAVDRSEAKIIAVGEKGLVRYSTDGGQTWAAPRQGFPDLFMFMRDLRFAPDARTGFIVGQRGTVLRTTDGGDTWQQVMPAPAAEAEKKS